MTADIAHSMEGWLRLLLESTAKAAPLALMALVLTLGLRRWMAPRWRHLLWLLVFARLVLPDLGAWQGSILRWQRAEASAPNLEQERPWTAPQELPSAPSEVLKSEPPSTLSAPAGGEYTRPIVALSAPVKIEKGWSAWELAGAVWIAGVLIMLAAMVVCSLRLHRRLLAGCRRAGGDWQALVDDIGARHGWRGMPSVWISPALNSPVLLGLWRPHILIPDDASLQDLPLARKRHLILHELAHWRRADLWAQTAGAVLLALHWFNPLLWLAHHRLRVESEACADAWVLQHEGADEAQAYGSTLLQLMTQTATAAVLLCLVPGMLGMAAGARELKSRLRDLALGQRRKRIWALLALALVVLAGAATFTRPASAQQQKPTGSPPGEAGIKGRVVDAQGRSVQGAKVRMHDSGPGERGKDGEMVSDAEGRFQFGGLVKGQTVEVSYEHPDYAISEAEPVTAGAEEAVQLKLNSPRIISGVVIAATDHKPVAGARVYLGSEAGEYTPTNWYAAGKSVLTDGQGKYQIGVRSRTEKKVLLRVESDQHATLVIPAALYAKDKQERNLELSPRIVLDGTVVDMSGKPVGNALVWVAEGSFYSRKRIDAAWIEARLKRANGDYEESIIKSVSDAAGRFQIKDVDPSVAKEPFVVVVNPSGIGRVLMKEFMKTRSVRLEPWITVYATFVSADGEPLASQNVRIDCDGEEERDNQAYLRLERTVSGVTDAKGKFAFEQVLPRSVADVMLDRQSASDEDAPLVFTSGGEVRNVTFTIPGKNTESAAQTKGKHQGQGLRDITGRAVLPEGATQPVGRVRIDVTAPNDDSVIAGARCAKDGGFVIPQLAAGRYLLSARLPKSSDSSGYMEHPAAMATKEFAFEAGAQGNAFNLGEVKLTKHVSFRERPLLALPKGPVATVTLKVRDDKGRPVAGAEAFGELLYPDHALVIPSEGLDDRVLVPRTLSDAAGVIVVKFMRDMPGRDPIAAANLRVEKAGLLSVRVEPLTDGETRTVVLKTPPVLEVRGTGPNADIWTALSSYFSKATPLHRAGDVFRGAVAMEGRQPFIVTDQGDPTHWKFSTVEIGDFEPGKVVTWNGVLQPGVRIEGRVKDIVTPFDGDAWAHIRLYAESPPAAGTVREAVQMFEIRPETMHQVSWSAWTKVKPDGSFAFPGVPRGRMDLSVIGPGWVADTDSIPLPMERNWPRLDVKEDLFKLELKGRKTFVQRIKVLAPDGRPASGARVRYYRSSNPGNNGYVARGHDRVPMDHVAKEERDLYLTWRKGETPGHRAVTGADGVTEMSNQPGGRTDFWVTWEDPATKELYRREVPIIVEGDPEKVRVVDLAKGERAR